MHPDRLLTLENLDFMNHHTRFMQCWLSIQNDHISISDMSIHLLVSCRWTHTGTCVIALSGEKLIGDSCSLLKSRSVLLVNCIPEEWMGTATYKRDLGTILILHHCRTRMSSWTVNDQLPHFVNIGSGHRFGISQLSSKDGWNSDFVCLDIDIWRNNGTGGVVDSFSLSHQRCMDPAKKSLPSCVS